ncbi:MAG TPA: hypothetical protein VLA56_10565, partial [Pseudomonadales bacterium]|nr:hypothetical protein [Pseudomonadales bacterium]
MKVMSVMRKQSYTVVLAVAAAIRVGTPASAAPQTPDPPSPPPQDHFHTFEARTYSGPVFTLDAALSEALASNPALVALRRQFDVARQRPAQER